MACQETRQIGPHWTETIPQFKFGSKADQAQLPVVKLRYSNGDTNYALVSPIFTDIVDRRMLLATLQFELTPDNTDISQNFPVELLEYGCFRKGDLECIIDFAGFAGSEEHRNKQWSHQYDA